MTRHAQQSSARRARRAATSSRRAWSPWRLALWVAFAAALPRLVYVLEVHAHPYYLTPLVDAADFHARALQVMRGEPVSAGVHYKAPAYAYLLGQLYRLVGPHMAVAYALQMLGGVLVALIVLSLASRWFDRSVGVVAALLTAWYAPAIDFENQLLIESLALTVSCVAVWFIVRSRTASMDLCAGAGLGLALQLRPINAALIGAVLLWLGVQRVPWTAKLRRAVFVLVPVACLLVPTARHNRLASGDLVLISVNGGINFYIGNNPDYDATVAIRPGLRWEELTRRFGAHESPADWQRSFYTAAFTYLRTHPSAAAALWWKKLVLFWNAQEIDRNQDSRVLRQASIILRWLHVPWSVLGTLGLVGLGYAVRLARPTPLVWLILVQMLGVVAFFVVTRYRAAVVPWIAIAAAVVLVELYRAGRDRRWRVGLGLGLAIVAAAACVLPDHYGVRAAPFGRPEFDRGEVLARLGDRTGALTAYESAVAAYPDDADVYFAYAEHLERLGRFDDAHAAFQRAADLAPSAYKPLLASGAAAIRSGDMDRAWMVLGAAAERGDPQGRTEYNLGLVRERSADYEAALLWYDRALEKPDSRDETGLRRLGKARCLMALGRHEAAEVEFRAAATGVLDTEMVVLDRAESWLGAGRPERTLAILQALANLDQSARGQFLRAHALVALGHREEARSAAMRACELEATNEDYRRLRERLATPE